MTNWLIERVDGEPLVAHVFLWPNKGIRPDSQWIGYPCDYVPFENPIGSGVGTNSMKFIAPSTKPESCI